MNLQAIIFALYFSLTDWNGISPAVVVLLLARPALVALVGSHAVSDRLSRYRTGSSIMSEHLMGLPKDSLGRGP